MTIPLGIRQHPARARVSFVALAVGPKRESRVADLIAKRSRHRRIVRAAARLQSSRFVRNAVERTSRAFPACAAPRKVGRVTLVLGLILTVSSAASCVTQYPNKRQVGHRVHIEREPEEIELHQCGQLVA